MSRGCHPGHASHCFTNFRGGHTHLQHLRNANLIVSECFFAISKKTLVASQLITGGAQCTILQFFCPHYSTILYITICSVELGPICFWVSCTEIEKRPCNLDKMAHFLQMSVKLPKSNIVWSYKAERGIDGAPLCPPLGSNEQCIFRRLNWNPSGLNHFHDFF